MRLWTLLPGLTTYIVFQYQFKTRNSRLNLQFRLFHHFSIGRYVEAGRTCVNQMRKSFKANTRSNCDSPKWQFDKNNVFTIIAMVILKPYSIFSQQFFRMVSEFLPAMSVTVVEFDCVLSFSKMQPSRIVNMDGNTVINGFGLRTGNLL